MFGKYNPNVRAQIKKERADAARQAVQRATGYIGGRLGGNKKIEADDEGTISEADEDMKSAGEVMDAAKKLISSNDKDSKGAQRRGKSMFPSLTFPRLGI